MKNNKEDWIHPDNNLGEMSIDITPDDAYEMLEGEVFDWCFPVYNRDENGTKYMIGNVNIFIGDINSEEEEE